MNNCTWYQSINYVGQFLVLIDVPERGAANNTHEQNMIAHGFDLPYKVYKNVKAFMQQIHGQDGSKPFINSYGEPQENPFSGLSFFAGTDESYKPSHCAIFQVDVSYYTANVFQGMQ